MVSIDLDSAQFDDEELLQALRQRGLRATSQRLLINRALRELDDHVTAEDVLRQVTGRLPGISLPTVYATLETLTELGAIRRVNAGAGAALWDTRSKHHHHACCSRCGRIVDLDFRLEDRAARRAAADAGFEPERSELTVVGVCPACREELDSA